MIKKNSISAVISVFNGEKELEDCLNSVVFADEIIVVNNSSTDNTLNIAKKFTDKIFTRSNNPMLNINKNFGFSKATGEWILCLDADERVDPNLQKEILDIVKNNKEENIIGYRIPRKNIIFGKWIEHTGWYPDYQLRLFKNGKGRFEEKHVHEMVKVDGKIEHLKNDLIHNNYSTITQFLQKMQLYTSNEAQNLMEKGYNLVWQDAIRFPLREFLSRFFAREGYKDGFHGLMLSLLMAFYHLIILAQIWEKKGFEERKDEDYLNNLGNEFKKSHRELLFWINTEKIKKEKDFFKKIMYKLFRKINST